MEKHEHVYIGYGIFVKVGRDLVDLYTVDLGKKINLLYLDADSLKNLFQYVRKFQEFKEILDADPGEKPARPMAERCAQLEAALSRLIQVCDDGRHFTEHATGGQTIETNLRATLINRVSSWEVEQARNILFQQD